jgi:nitroreductase
METLECIRRCVAVRDFTPEPVADPILRRVLEAGRWAQSSKNSQPWHFIVIEDRETLEKLSSLTPTGPHLARAPMGIAVATIGAKMPHVDASRAIQNMVLAAWDQGLGTCWIANYDEEEVKRLLNLPEEAVFITAMPYGHPTDAEAARRKRRKPLEEIVHWERFGNRRPI